METEGNLKKTLVTIATTAEVMRINGKIVGSRDERNKARKLKIIRTSQNWAKPKTLRKMNEISAETIKEMKKSLEIIVKVFLC